MSDHKIGLSERELPATPKARAEWLQWFDSTEPVEMTAAEEAEWLAARRAIKEYTIANTNKRIEGLIREALVA